MAGSKPELADKLAEIYIAATEAGLSPDAYRTREMERKGQKPRKATTARTNTDDAIENWSLAQLRQAVQERGMKPKGISSHLLTSLCGHKAVLR